MRCESCNLSLRGLKYGVGRDSGCTSDGLACGDVILLRHGDRVPVDGILLEREF